jgi:cytochrome c553
MMNTARRWILDLTVWTVGLLASTLLITHDAMASGRLSAPVNDRWRAECGSCHIAYPPQLLPAQAWRQLMSQLDRHFGTDASIDPAAAGQIGLFLERHAGSGGQAPGAANILRITETAWFLDEHDEVPQASWKSPAVKSAANCAACHTAAGRGDFHERNIRIPR